MTKHVKQQDFDHEIIDDNDDVIQNKKESSKKNSSSDKKSNHENQKKEQKGQDIERREKERREKERRERGVRDAERQQRDSDVEKWGDEERVNELPVPVPVPVIIKRYKPRRPPAGYRDPHEVVKRSLPKKVKEEKRQEIKALMNCIAFDPIDEKDGKKPTSGRSRPKPKAKPVVEEIDNSVSSDTTSDITDVTPRSSSSGCSSMSKQSMNAEEKESTQKPKRSKSENRTADHNKLRQKMEPNVTAVEYTEDRNNRKQTDKPKKSTKKADVNENELDELKYLQDAFEDFDIDEEASDFASSIISGLSEERRLKSGRKNMTFTNEQIREIERVNLILLKKIMGHKKAKPPASTQVPAATHRKSSAAINRAKLEKKIEHENMILLKKLQSVKGTTGSMPRNGTTY